MKIPILYEMERGIRHAICRWMFDLRFWALISLVVIMAFLAPIFEESTLSHLDRTHARLEVDLKEVRSKLCSECHFLKEWFPRSTLLEK